jgi:hypothetical protein
MAFGSADESDSDPPSIRPWLVTLVVFVVLVLARIVYSRCLGSAPQTTCATCPGFDNCLKEALAYVLAPCFGALVGATELIARYRDKPSAAVSNPPAILYMVVNALAALAAFWLVYTDRLGTKAEIFGDHKALNALILGGFGAMALFRTSVFNLRVRDTTVGVGPAAVLQVILRVTDREVDRLRAGPRARVIKQIMEGVSYELAREALPFHCYALMQNLSLEERSDLDQAITVLDSRKSMSDETKAYNLGLLLMDLVGEDVLRRAVDGIAGRIKGPLPDDPPVLSRAAELKLADLPALLETTIALRREPLDAKRLGAFRDSWNKVDEGVTLESDRIVIALAKLRTFFGPETVAKAIAALLAPRGKTLPADAAVPPGAWGGGPIAGAAGTVGSPTTG